MLSNFSWSDFIIGVATIIALYYIFVAIKYYDTEIKEIISGKRKLNFRTLIPASKDADQDFDEELSDGSSKKHFEMTSDEDFSQVENLIEQLKKVISNAAENNLINAELKHSIRLVLKEYPAIKISAIRQSVNELILSECEKYGSEFSDVEVDMLWYDS